MFDNDKVSTHEYPDTGEIIEYEGTPDGTHTGRIHIMFPQLFGKRRTGETFVRKLKVKDRIHDANVVKSFEAQDRIKNDWRTADMNGHDPRFTVLLPDGSRIIFSRFISEWFMTNSMIANLYRSGWDIRS